MIFKRINKIFYKKSTNNQFHLFYFNINKGYNKIILILQNKTYLFYNNINIIRNCKLNQNIELYLSYNDKLIFYEIDKNKIIEKIYDFTFNNFISEKIYNVIKNINEYIIETNKRLYILKLKSTTIKEYEEKSK